MKKTLITFFLVLAGCVNPYAKFYNGLPDARTTPTYLATNEPLKIYNTNDFDRDRKILIQKGYWPVGTSSFNAGADAVSESQLREQAQKIGAHAVLISAKFSHTVTGAIPITVPNTSTSYTSGSATAYGSGGSATAYGNSTTTTYGSSTSYVPYTVNRSDFNALYFIRVKARIGFIVEPLSDDVKRKFEKNSGVRVAVVVDGTAAFDADILPGDILFTFDGMPVRSVDHYQELLSTYSKDSVELGLNRDGRPLQKTVKFTKL